MLNETDVIGAVSLDFLQRGYSILEKCTVDSNDVDIVASWPESGAKMFISAVGVPRSSAGKEEPEASCTESQIFYCISRAIIGAMGMKDSCKFSPGDRLALAFPDTPGFREQLRAQEPFLNSFGVEVFLVNEEKKIEKL